VGPSPVFQDKEAESVMRAAKVLCLVLVASSVALADSKGRAKERYQQAIKHYNLTEYKEALDGFKDAYREVSEPSLLFNIAQCYRQLDDKAQALRFYRNFLREIPDAPNRLEVKGLVQKLEAAVAEEARARSSPPQGTLEQPTAPPPPTPAPPPPAQVVVVPRPPPIVHEQPRGGRGKLAAGLAVGAVGVAALATGIAFGVLARGAAADLTRIDQTQGNFDASREKNGLLDQTLQGVFLGVGAAALLTGVVVAAVGGRERRRVNVAAAIAPGFGGAVVKVGF